MNRLLLAATALLLLTAVPASAMSCCGGKGKTGMCAKGETAKGGTAMNQCGAKGSKCCCCEGMSGNMSKRG